MPPASTPSPPTLVDVFWSDDCIASNAAAVVDVVRTLNTLASMRPHQGPVAQWRWRTPGVQAAPLACAGPVLPIDANEAQGADLLVFPGWLAPSGPGLERVCLQWGAHPWVASALQRCARVLACFNSAAVWAPLGHLSGRTLAFPWVFAPTLVRLSAGGVQWQRPAHWHHDAGLWSSCALPDTVPALLDALGTTPVRDWVMAARAALCFDPERQATAALALPTPTGEVTQTGAVELARRWLQAHFREPYQLEQIARAAHTSPRSLLRWFAQVEGQTPLDYLHRLRVAHAQNLLQTTYLGVDAIAAQCGYNDTGSLRKVFVRYSAMGLAQYRRRFQLRTARKLWSGPPQA